MRRETLVTWAVIIGVWTLAAAFLVGQYYAFHVNMGVRRPFDWTESVTAETTFACCWMLGTRWVLFLADRYRIEPPRILASVLRHVVLCVCTAVVIHLVSVTNSLPGKITAGGAVVWGMIFGSVIITIHNSLILYWIILGLHHLGRYYRELQAGKLRAAQLEAQLSQSRLQALKMQLHPHFLFNALNSISALQLTDMEQAHTMTARLGDFLRLTLKASNEAEVPLAREIDFLKHYLEIEQLRFQDRMTVTFDIDPETLDAVVPNLLLQPIVENAVRHAVASRLSPVSIIVRTEFVGERLRLQIRDTGPGLRVEPVENVRGVGLSNTRRRLAQRYGDNHRFDLFNHPEGGLVAVIEIPAFRAPSFPAENRTMESEESKAVL